MGNQPSVNIAEVGGTVISSTVPIPVGPTKLDGTGLTRVTVNISTATTTTVVALTAAQSVRVYKMVLNFAAAQTLDIRSSTAGSLIGAAMSFGAGGCLVLDFDSEPWFVTTAGEALTFVTTTTGAITGTVYYVKS